MDSFTKYGSIIILSLIIAVVYFQVKVSCLTQIDTNDEGVATYEPEAMNTLYKHSFVVFIMAFSIAYMAFYISTSESLEDQMMSNMHTGEPDF